MRRQQRRRATAWALLSVFVSMMMLCGLHRHHDVVNPAADCIECAHHVHHSGHITTADDGVHDCLICHFISLNYTLAEVLAISAPASLLIMTWCSDFGCIIQRACSQDSTRAPPFILFS